MTTHHVATKTEQTPDAAKAHSSDLIRPEPGPPRASLKQVPKKVSGKLGAAPPTCESGPPGAVTTVKEHIMSTTHDFKSSTFAIPSDDMTAAAAWASSPLGDPAIEDGSLLHPNDFEYDEPASATAKPRWTGRNAVVAAALVGAIGAVGALGFILVNGNGSNEPKPTGVVPGSHIGTSTSQAPSPNPSSVTLAPTSPVTPPDTGQPPTQTPAPAGGGYPALAPAPSGGGSPADPGTPSAGGDTPADPGTPPAGAPDTPPVIVNVPPVIPIPVPIPIPIGPGGGTNGPILTSGSTPNGPILSGGSTPNGGQSGATSNGGQSGMTPGGGQSG